MNTDSKNPSSSQSDVLPTSRLFDDWIDPIESGVRARVRDWIEALVHSELDAALQRPRYGRSTGGETEPAVAPVRGYRNGSRTRTLTGTFGQTDITVPRARLQGADGATTEWKSKALRAYQRRTKAADALIASAYLSGTNTRRFRVTGPRKPGFARNRPFLHCCAPRAQRETLSFPKIISARSNDAILRESAPPLRRCR